MIDTIFPSLPSKATLTISGITRDATYLNDRGVSVMVYDTCIVCSRCVQLCPVPGINPLVRLDAFRECPRREGEDTEAKERVEATA